MSRSVFVDEYIRPIQPLLAWDEIRGRCAIIDDAVGFANAPRRVRPRTPVSSPSAHTSRAVSGPNSGSSLDTTTTTGDEKVEQRGMFMSPSINAGVSKYGDVEQLDDAQNSIFSPMIVPGRQHEQNEKRHQSELGGITNNIQLDINATTALQSIMFRTMIGKLSILFLWGQVLVVVNSAMDARSRLRVSKKDTWSQTEIDKLGAEYKSAIETTKQKSRELYNEMVRRFVYIMRSCIDRTHKYEGGSTDNKRGIVSVEFDFDPHSHNTGMTGGDPSRPVDTASLFSPLNKERSPATDVTELLLGFAKKVDVLYSVVGHTHASSSTSHCLAASIVFLSIAKSAASSREEELAGSISNAITQSPVASAFATFTSTESVGVGVDAFKRGAATDIDRLSREISRQLDSFHRDLSSPLDNIILVTQSNLPHYLYTQSHDDGDAYPIQQGDAEYTSRTAESIDLRIISSVMTSLMVHLGELTETRRVRGIGNPLTRAGRDVEMLGLLKDIGLDVSSNRPQSGPSLAQRMVSVVNNTLNRATRPLARALFRGDQALDEIDTKSSSPGT
jgi:hypothetical protein